MVCSRLVDGRSLGSLLPMAPPSWSLDGRSPLQCQMSAVHHLQSCVSLPPSPLRCHHSIDALFADATIDAAITRVDVYDGAVCKIMVVINGALVTGTPLCSPVPLPRLFVCHRLKVVTSGAVGSTDSPVLTDAAISTPSSADCTTRGHRHSTDCRRKKH